MNEIRNSDPPKSLKNLLAHLGVNLERRFDDIAGLSHRLDTVAETLSILGGALDRQGERLSRLEEYGAKCADIERKVDAIETRIDAIDEHLARLGQEYRCLEHASEQQKLLSKEFIDSQVIEPLARELFPLIDMASHSSENGDGAETLSNFYRYLHEVLGRLDVETITCREGEPFDPKVMRPVRTVEIEDSARDRTVAKVLQTGFQRGSRILRQVTVVINKSTRKEGDQYGHRWNRSGDVQHTRLGAGLAGQPGDTRE